MDKIEQQRQHFENTASDYYQARQSKNHLMLKHLLWHYFFSDKKYLAEKRIAVLEPMCGYSEGKDLIERYLTKDIEYEGFDYSDTLVEIVKKKRPGVKIYKMDVTKFKSDKKFDLIILIGSLHHVPDYTKDVIANLSKYLNKGGYFINYEPTHNNFVFRKVREYIYQKNSFLDKDTERGFELSELNGYFKDAGFKLVDQIHCGLLSFILYYNPDVFPKLNVGNTKLVRSLFSIDKLFFRNIIGRKLSFGSISLWQKE